MLGLESVPDSLANGLLAGVNPLLALHGYLVGTIVGALTTSTVLMSVQATGAMAVIISDVPQTQTGDARAQEALAVLAILAGVGMLGAGHPPARVARALRAELGPGRLRQRRRDQHHPVAGRRGHRLPERREQPRAQGPRHGGSPRSDRVRQRRRRGADHRAHRAARAHPAAGAGDGRRDRPRVGAAGRPGRPGQHGAGRPGALGHRDRAPQPSHVPAALARPGRDDGGACTLARLRRPRPGCRDRRHDDQPRRLAPGDASGDFRGQGIANLATGVLQGTPVAGSMSATNLVRAAGARTATANLFAGVVIGAIDAAARPTSWATSRCPRWAASSCSSAGAASRSTSWC